MEGNTRKVLWADDEIELLRSHHLYLDERGYKVTPVTNGEDAIALLRKEHFDIVLLDEMMPGLDGLSTLEQLKQHDPTVPVIMITKNEEEHLMDEAIGKRIDDYLTKPVNPSQIFMACKKILDARQIRQSRAGLDWVSHANQIREWLAGEVTWRTWIDVHRSLSEWELEMAHVGDTGLRQMLEDQRRDCNLEFGRYVERHYPGWLEDEDSSPPLSVDVVSEHVAPHLQQGRQVFFIVIDCLRLDHWMAIEPLVSQYYGVRRSHYYAILPTATPYARNALFAGLWPDEIARRFPQYWVESPKAEQSLNRFEKELLGEQLIMKGLGDIQFKYVKVSNISAANELFRQIGSFRGIPLVAMVFNF
ncbi:MAG: bifunctional response regulator/alkaline phosphatase family protein, partial [Gemmatimonadota bacterium]